MDQSFSDKPRRSLLVPILIALSVILFIFGIWAFNGMQTNKKSVSAANNTASQALASQKTAETKYNDLLQKPYKTFTGPNNYGTISFNYPKNWSAYVDSGGGELINAYFYPDQVPSTQSDTAFALRLELLDSDYATVVQQFSASVSQGSITSHAYVPPAMAKNASAQPGVKLDGAITQTSTGTTLQGSMVILKVRDKTLQVYTQANSFESVFDSVVLPSLTFVP
jgi:hypothetical protein